MMPKHAATLRSRALRLRDGRLSGRSDLGQTALVAVIAVSVIVSLIGATIVATVVQSVPLQQASAITVYAHRALQAGENAYVTAVNANPTLAQCNNGTNQTTACAGLDYAEWNKVTNSDQNGGVAEWYAFGNPQPTFDPTTHALTDLSVQVVGAANAPHSTTNYVFQSENINLTAANGFLTNVWWSNFESYSQNGNYSNCNYNWKIGYDINAGSTNCGPVDFGPSDYLFGPVYTNDSVFVGGANPATVTGSPSFGDPGVPSVRPAVPSAVHTADPNCLFVDSSNGGGMSGSDTNCATNANGDVYLYDHTNSSNGNQVELPPSSDAQLGTIASQNGCLYSGPTQIQMRSYTDPVTNLTVGQMQVSSPDTIEASGTEHPNGNLSNNPNNCPNDGTTWVPLPANGVVYVQNASTNTYTTQNPPPPGTVSQTIQGSNPFDDYINNTVTNLTDTAGPTGHGQPVSLTATVTSESNQIPAGATVSFSQTTTSGTSVIAACSAQSNWSAVGGPTGGPYTASVTCPTFNEASNGTGAFSATYSGGTYTSSSQGSLTQNNTLNPTLTYGANSQTNAGLCTACYYGDVVPDTEGDAFVNGNLSGQLTIGTQNNVIIDGNLTYADCTNHWMVGQSGAANSFCPYFSGGTNDSLGLIADNYVEVNHPVTSPTGSVLPSCGASYGALCDPSNSGGGLTIDAAILALTQSFVVNNYKQGGDEGQLNVYGSIQQYARGPVGTFNANDTTASGYVKHYTWNPLLDFASPPAYLTPSTAPWVLSSVNGNGGEHTTTVCPALMGAYSTTGTTAPITQYCSGMPYGLPGYPAVTVPGPPTDAAASTSGGGSATITWVDPAANDPGGITKYNIIANPACPGCTGMTQPVGTATSATITGLTPGTAYVFTVTATNANGTGDPSNPTSSVTSPTVPYAPTQVNAVGNVNDTVSVNWTDPSAVGSPITQYTVTPSPACPLCTGLTGGSAATSVTISGLTVGGTYTFTVTATNGLGTGPPSTASNPVVVPTLPGAPTGVSGTSYSSAYSVVSWSPPASTGGLPITGYAVTSSPGNKTCTTTGTPSCTVSTLTNGTAYTFTVKATNAIGTGPASAASPPATPSVAPGAPTIGTATNGVSSATVTFTAPGSNGGAPITSYTATSNPSGITGTCASSPCVVNGLTPGTSYKFTVAATNGSGTGPSSGSSNSITATGPPSAPTGVSATSYGNTQSVVSWTAPYNGGSAITSYTVTSSGGQTCTTPNGTTTTCTVTGLINGTTYTFTVTATNVLGTGNPSATATATVGTVPSAPTIGVATGGYQSATVTWSAPASNGGLAITGYTVTATPGSATCSTSATSCTLTGLTNGTSYTFKVTATNAAGTSAASSASNAVVPANTVPGAPTAVNATSYANTQSVVSWTAAASNGSALTKYTVTSSGGQTCTTANGTTTNCTVTGLTNGVAYTFTVTATNGIGTGPASAPSAPATPSTLPGAATGVTATANSNAQSFVYWTAPASNGGAAITNYTVTSSPGGKTCTSGAGTSCTVLGLTNGTSYTFTVTATNGSGTGPASGASSAIIPAAPPGAPTAVAATSNANAQSVVTWTAPASNGGTAITVYTVTSSGGQTCNTPNGTTRTCTVTGLTNGTAYTFTVTATNAAGTGPPSAASSPATPATKPGAPTGVTAVSDLNSLSVVSWTAPASDGGSPITGYTVTSSPGALVCTSTTTTSCTVNGLTNGTTYTFTVTATNALGTGPASSPSSPIVPAATPGVPTSVTATSYANSQSVVSWTAPASTGGSPITSYTVTPNIGQPCVTSNGSTTSCDIQGLTNGTTYTFTVFATNALGNGLPSAPVSATPSTVPTAPTSVVATSYANTKSVVSWSTPSSNGGAAITGYTVTATDTTHPANGGQVNSSAASPLTMTGLTNGDAYTFTVTATNASGVGPASAASAPATPSTIPGAATNVAGSSYANTSSVVSWTPPASNGGAPITNYTVTSSPGAFTCSSVATFCTVGGLTNGTSYTFTVVATNGSGSGPTSAASLPATPATFPGAPTGAVAVATGSSTSASVSWSAPTVNGGAPVTGYTVTSNPGPYVCSTSATTCVFSGLTTGTAYTFTVTAANGAGSGGASLPSNSLTVGTPGVPSAVAVVSYQNTQVPVSWTASPANGGSAITGYTATASPGGQFCTTPNGTTTNCTVAGLANGTSYTFTVTATNAVGVGNASVASAAAIPATAPSAPTGVAGTSYANTQSVVSWTASANSGGTPVTSYKVTSSGGQTCTTPNGTTTTCTVTGLTNGTPYTFTVTATNLAGTSGVSATSAPATPATVPGAPTAVSATSYANTQSVVSWTAPASNGGAAISSYTVTSNAGQVCTTPNGTTTTCTVTGLTNGTSYTFTVTATNAAGTSSSSVASAAATPATVPTAPTAVTATSNANAQSVVSWTNSSYNGGLAISGYTVTSSGGQTCSASSSTCTVVGLTNGTTYTFTVTAANVVGNSPPSSPVATATPATVPSAPTGVTATSNANTQSVVSWTASASNGGAAISSYTVTSNAGQVCTTPNGTTTTCTVTGLTNGTSYTFTVKATNSAGTSAASAASAAAIPATTPGAPTSVNASSYANAQSVVSWNAPASNGGVAISSYTVTSSGGQICTTPNGTTTTCTVAGLTNGTPYTFTVTATNSAGTSTSSAPSAAATPATTPGTPTGVTATSNANTQSVVSWTAPASNGGAAITGYTVTASPGIATCSATVTTCTVTGLTNGTAYTFTVTAINAAGTGSASAPSAAATPATTPSVPTSVTATSNANTQSVVSWTAPASNGGAAISGYKATSNAGQFCTTPNGTTTTCTVTGLTNGTPYTFTVTATNSAGTSSASAASAAATPATDPGRPDQRDGNVQRQHPVGGVLDRTGQQRRSGHLRLHGDLERRPVLHHAQRDDHDVHRHRPDQRDAVHLHRDGHQLGRNQRGLGGVGGGHASHHPGRPDQRDGNVQRQHPVGGVVDGTGQ